MPVGVLGGDVVATLVAPGIPFGVRLGARIEVPETRAIVSYWRPAVYDPAADTWTATLEYPAASGPLNLVWRTGDPEPPVFEQFVPLVAA